jgi:hypothetical protein
MGQLHSQLAHSPAAVVMKNCDPLLSGPELAAK